MSIYQILPLLGSVKAEVLDMRSTTQRYCAMIVPGAQPTA